MPYWLFAIFLTTLVHAQTETTYNRDIISDPNLSSRCKELLEERDAKIKTRQRIQGLIQRNQILLKKTPAMREKLTKRLEATALTLRNEFYISGLQVQNFEEAIIRSGCPGINL